MLSLGARKEVSVLRLEAICHWYITADSLLSRAHCWKNGANKMRELMKKNGGLQIPQFGSDCHYMYSMPRKIPYQIEVEILLHLSAPLQGPFVCTFIYWELTNLSVASRLNASTL